MEDCIYDLAQQDFSIPLDFIRNGEIIPLDFVWFQLMTDPGNGIAEVELSRINPGK